MNPFYIKDYGLTPAELQYKYDPDNDEGQHPGYTFAEHRASQSGLLYWDWVVSQLWAEEDELSESSPYNHE